MVDTLDLEFNEIFSYGFKSHYPYMINRYIPHLSWKRKNLAYILLYTVFKHTINKTIQVTKKDNSRNIKKKDNLIALRQRFRKIKNNQFNIKWFFNKYLKYYYDINISKLFNVESRLDIILFRTNWFINKEAARSAIKTGLIKINNNIVVSSRMRHINLTPGDIVEFNDSYFNKNFLLSELYKGSDSKNLVQINRHKSGSFSLYNWNLENNYNIIPNVPYLEINNKIKTLIMLKHPTFKDIPYPFNLRKFRG